MIQGGDVFSDMVDESLRVAMQNLMAGQLLVGTGVSPSVTGLTNVTGIALSDYMSTSRGAASGFRDGENMLEGRAVRAGDSSDVDRRVKLVPRGSRNAKGARRNRRLRHTGRARARRGIGAQERANWRTISCRYLSISRYVVLAVWDTLDLTLDMVTKPGNMQITLTSWFDVVVLRPTSIVLVSQA